MKMENLRKKDALDLSLGKKRLILQYYPAQGCFIIPSAFCEQIKVNFQSWAADVSTRQRETQAGSCEATKLIN